MNAIIRASRFGLRRCVRLSALLVAALVIAPPAMACRELPKADAFKYADTVLVAHVSSVRIPAMETAPASDLNQTDIDLGFTVNSPRIIRLVVLRQARGPRSAHVLKIRIRRCQGLLVDPGERVIAYHFPNGTWRIDQAPVDHSGMLPPEMIKALRLDTMTPASRRDQQGGAVHQ